ncbi:MAG: type II toxin-antitoxin system PemK/MazF family toxin [Chloroflexi bacterium]|nr:type II toxin-antitoxin system PemK/MazF family toxin [Chloroflexota bacterium]
MRRGEIWWANLPPPVGRRPVLLPSRDESYDRRGMIIVSTITSRARNLPTEVPLGTAERLERASVLNLDNIQTIPKRNLTEFVSTLSPQKLQDVEVALHYALGLDS